MTENPTRFRIARWLRGILEGPRAPSARPEKLVLRHLNLNERQVDIAAFPLSQAANDNGLDLGDLAMRIEETAHDDAEGLGGVQHYVIHAICEDRALSRLPFRVSGGGDISLRGEVDEPLESEPANGRGLLAQGMRHLEAMTRLHAEALGQLVITQQRTISRLAATNEVGEERRLQAVETAEAMMSERQERVLKVEESKARTRMWADIAATVTPVGPKVIEYLTGSGEKHAKQLIELHGRLITRLAKSPERVERVLAALDPEERALFEAILESVPPPDDPEDGTEGTGGDDSPTDGPPPGSPQTSSDGPGPRPVPNGGPRPSRPAPSAGPVGPKPDGGGPRAPGPPPRRTRAGAAS